MGLQLTNSNRIFHHWSFIEPLNNIPAFIRNEPCFWFVWTFCRTDYVYFVLKQKTSEGRGYMFVSLCPCAHQFFNPVVASLQAIGAEISALIWNNLYKSVCHDHFKPITRLSSDSDFCPIATLVRSDSSQTQIRTRADVGQKWHHLNWLFHTVVTMQIS